MTIEEIMQIEDLEKRVEELKSGRPDKQRTLTDVLKSIDVSKHDVFDKTLRKDKPVVNDNGTTLEPVQRTGFALQKLIIKREVAFIFGNPVEYTSKSENAEVFLERFKSILDDAKIDSFNRKVARDLFSTTEVAELWFPVPSKSEDGIDNFKLRVKKMSVLTGDRLYPYFDEYGDMVAFSREFEIGEDTFFETYTDTQIIRYNLSESAVIVDGFPKLNPAGKIPIVYGKRAEASYDDIDKLINRLENLISNFGDTNDYHAAPKLFIKGTIKGFSKKGESGAIIEGDANTSAQYLSWSNAPESVKLEISMLKEMIYTISQTPDISFESIKSSVGGTLSGKAMRFMFLDAHLKVMDNMEVFDEYLQRRTNIIKSFMSKIDTSTKSDISKIKINAVVTPYMLDDTSDELEFIMTATGNKPVLSQKSGIMRANLSKNAEEEYAQIQKENSVDAFEPTEL